MIEARLPDFGGTLLLAPVRGLLADAARLGPALDAFGPRAVGLAVAPDELKGLADHFGAVGAEPLVPLSPGETAELKALVRYGDAAVPNPAFTATLAWGRDRGVAVEAIDPADEDFATMFTDHIGYTELLRRTLKERRLVRHPPAPATADDFALAWGGAMANGRGSEALARARDASAAAALRLLAARSGRVAAIVDRERFDGLVAAWRTLPIASAPAR